MIGPYRAHGPLRWLLDQFPAIGRWDVIGSLGAEERSATVPRQLRELGGLGACQLLRIHDLPTAFGPAVEQAVHERESELLAALGKAFEVRDEQLMSDLPELEPLGDELESIVAEHVILDISCLPKRFFFYLLRRLIASSRVQHLLVTVTIPGKYGDELSRDAGRWEFLPSFGRERSDKAKPMLIIGVGYQHLNLLDVVEEGDPSAVRLLFPFPSKPPGGIRNWEFVRNIEQQKKFGLRSTDIIRVHPQAASLAFDILVGQCGEVDEVWLAPFGPKAISLAMVLFALARENAGLPVSMGYTQPPAYSATYSTGVELGTDGHPMIHAYCIKLNGRTLYRL